MLAAFLCCFLPHFYAQRLVVSLKAGATALVTNNTSKITADPSPLAGINILCYLEDFQICGALFYGNQQFRANEPLVISEVAEEYINQIPAC